MSTANLPFDIRFEEALVPLPGERLRVLGLGQFEHRRTRDDRLAEVVRSGDGWLVIRFIGDGTTARLVVGEDAWRWAESHKQRKARRV